MIPTKRIPLSNHSSHYPALENHPQRHTKQIRTQPHMDGVQDTNVTTYVWQLGYEWPFTQVKTWAYRKGTRCLRPRIVQNWAGLKTRPQNPMQITTIPKPHADGNHPVSSMQPTPSMCPCRMAVISHSIQENRQVFKEDPTLCVGERWMQCLALLKGRSYAWRWLGVGSTLLEGNLAIHGGRESG